MVLWVMHSNNGSQCDLGELCGKVSLVEYATLKAMYSERQSVLCAVNEMVAGYSELRVELRRLCGIMYNVTCSE